MKTKMLALVVAGMMIAGCAHAAGFAGTWVEVGGQGHHLTIVAKGGGKYIGITTRAAPMELHRGSATELEGTVGNFPIHVRIYMSGAELDLYMARTNTPFVYKRTQK